MKDLLEQGSIVELDFDDYRGHEAAKRRPAVVMSVGRFNNILSSLTIVCPITTTDNRHPLHIFIESDGVSQGYLCVEQLRAVDLLARNYKLTGESVDDLTMDNALDMVAAVFGI